MFLKREIIITEIQEEKVKFYQLTLFPEMPRIRAIQMKNLLGVKVNWLVPI